MTDPHAPHTDKLFPDHPAYNALPPPPTRPYNDIVDETLHHALREFLVHPDAIANLRDWLTNDRVPLNYRLSELAHLGTLAASEKEERMRRAEASAQPDAQTLPTDTAVFAASLVRFYQENPEA